ncbi:hypothetical protein Tco_1146198 [Tanacetum coccineum]
MNTVSSPIANQIQLPVYPPVHKTKELTKTLQPKQEIKLQPNQIYRLPINQPPVHQAPPYQAPAPQTQGVTKIDFESYVKANDAVMRIPIPTFYFSSSWTTSNSGTMKPSDKDTIASTNNGLSASMPNMKPSIQYPSRRNDERRHEKANDQIEKFYKIFQDMSFEINLADALNLMPKYSSNYDDKMANRIDVIEMAFEELFLKKFSVSPIDFLLEEVNAFLALEDDPTSPEVDETLI